MDIISGGADIEMAQRPQDVGPDLLEGNIVNTYQSKITGSEMNEFDAFAGFHHANPAIRFTD